MATTRVAPADRGDGAAPSFAGAPASKITLVNLHLTAHRGDHRQLISNQLPESLKVVRRGVAIHAQQRGRCPCCCPRNKVLNQPLLLAPIQPALPHLAILDPYR